MYGGILNLLKVLDMKEQIMILPEEQQEHLEIMINQFPLQVMKIILLMNCLLTIFIQIQEKHISDMKEDLLLHHQLY